MRIQLIDGYYIIPEPQNYTLRRVRSYISKDKQEKVKDEALGYCKDLRHAMELFVANLQRDKLGDLSVDSFAFVKKIEEINKAAVSALCAAIEGKEQHGES